MLLCFSFLLLLVTRVIGPTITKTRNLIQTGIFVSCSSIATQAA